MITIINTNALNNLALPAQWQHLAIIHSTASEEYKQQRGPVTAQPMTRAMHFK